MNRYAPHVYVVPEDDRDRQVANGFVGHHRVRDSRIKVMPPVGGWPKVLETFQGEYIPKLRNYSKAHVVLLIDFDGHVEERRDKFAREIPGDVKARVFVLGSKHNPETLRKALKIQFEEIGRSLADDCDTGSAEHWDHSQLQHNDAERQRLVETVKPFLF